MLFIMSGGLIGTCEDVVAIMWILINKSQEHSSFYWVNCLASMWLIGKFERWCISLTKEIKNEKKKKEINMCDAKLLGNNLK